MFEFIDCTHQFSWDHYIDVSSYKYIKFHYFCEYPHAQVQLSQNDLLKVDIKLNMFFQSMKYILRKNLDPSLHKRHQKDISVGCIDLISFVYYFGCCCNGKRKYEYDNFYYWNQYKSIPLICYEFNGFENMPLLGENTNNMMKRWNTNVMKKKNNTVQNEIYYYRIYFNNLVVKLNPESFMVKIDFYFNLEFRDSIDWKKI